MRHPRPCLPLDEQTVFLAIFDQDKRRVSRGKRRRKSPYEHRFGGAVEYSGLQPNRRQPPIHLLFRINTDDPLVPIDFGRRAKWLPLLCAIRFGACNLGYMVVSDTEILILHQGEKSSWDGFPYDGYPHALSVENVNLVEYEYDPSKPRDALFHAGVFGCDHLTDQQMTKLERFVAAKGLCNPDLNGETPAEFIRDSCWPYVQGPPHDDCPNPKCRNHRCECSLRTFAVFHESEQRLPKLWGQNCGDLQIIYQICPRCKAIRTTNQCT